VSFVCSPDGQRAILSAEVGGLATLDFRSGRRTPFYDNRRAKEIFSNIAWTADSKALITSSVTPFGLDNFSLGYLTYPRGLFTRVTHDLDSYGFPSITADGKTIVALRRDSGLEFRSIDLPLPGIGPDPAALRWSEFLGWWNNDTLVGTTTDGSLKLTDVNTGQERTLPKPRGMQFLQPNGCGQQGIGRLRKPQTGSAPHDLVRAPGRLRPTPALARARGHTSRLHAGREVGRVCRQPRAGGNVPGTSQRWTAHEGRRKHSLVRRLLPHPPTRLVR